MNSIGERLLNLYSELGFGVSEGDSDYAFIYAFSKVLKRIAQHAESELDAITTLDERRLLELLGVDIRRYGTKEKALEKADFLLKQRLGVYDIADYNREFGITGLEGYAHWAGRSFYVMGAPCRNGVASYKRVGEFLKQYLPAWVEFRAYGKSTTFDTWESFNFSFSEIDSFGLPFSVLLKI